MGVCGPRIAHRSFTLLGMGPRPTPCGEVKFLNPQLRQRFPRLERVTGIEPALSAWEEFLSHRVLLCCNGFGGLT
jgi:hypothetical protein